MLIIDLCFSLFDDDFVTRLNFFFFAFSHLNSYLSFANYMFNFQGAYNLLIKIMVGLSGLEPPTSRLSGVRSNLLSYEPLSTVAPVHLTSKEVVEMNGFEPMTPCLQSRCSPS